MDIHLGDRQVFAYSGSRALVPGQPSMVFVHGAAHDHSVWSLQSRYFAWHGFNVLAVDLPGHGRSPGAPLASIAAIADFLAEVVDVVGVGPATLVGHSMGALAALDCAARHAGKVARIALLGPAVPMAVSDELIAAARDDAELAYAMINAWSFAPAHALGRNPSPGMAMTGASLRLMQRSGPGVLHTDLVACNRYAEGLAAAARVRCPALLVIGARDQMAPPKGTPPLVAALPGATVVTLPDTGHALMAEAPDAVLDALKRFVAADMK